MSIYNYISPNEMWSMYLFNQTDPKKGAELLDENIIRPADAKVEPITLSFMPIMVMTKYLVVSIPM